MKRITRGGYVKDTCKIKKGCFFSLFRAQVRTIESAETPHGASRETQTLSRRETASRKRLSVSKKRKRVMKSASKESARRKKKKKRPPSGKDCRLFTEVSEKYPKSPRDPALVRAWGDLGGFECPIQTLDGVVKTPFGPRQTRVEASKTGSICVFRF